ncbi:unnamed protein product [Prorocentrum cordatum]|uniref:WWE domain-containing protein n=1 Tax=Prorocentrum cordatum TaxID=2364126 RepID=A0ABN9W744_9DINO|nr:unnamed protein product [Polarella glacialis]
MTEAGARWQREHSTGWQSYSKGVARKIENAFLAGESKVRLRLLRPAGDERKEDQPYPMVEIFFNDMVQHDPWNDHRHRVRRCGHTGLLFHARWAVGRLRHLADTGRWRLEAQEEYEARRDAVTGQILALLEKKEEDVNTFWMRHQRSSKNSSHSSKRSFVHPYSNMENGWARVATTQWFFFMSMSMVVLNAAWMWVDTDNSRCNSFVQAEVEVQVVEVAFSLYFSAELLIRWKAYDHRSEALRDKWFLFDAVLVVFMFVEIVVLPASIVVINSGTGDPGADIGVFRTLRLLRLSRIARLLRAIPELMMLIRGIAASLRTVSFTVLLLSGLLFIFAIVFKTQVKGDPLEERMFQSVFKSMMTLLMHGTLLDSPNELYLEIADEWPELLFAFLVFIFLSSFTLLNMLIVADSVRRRPEGVRQGSLRQPGEISDRQPAEHPGGLRHERRPTHQQGRVQCPHAVPRDPRRPDEVRHGPREPDTAGRPDLRQRRRRAPELQGVLRRGDAAARRQQREVKDMVELRIFVAQQMESLGRQIGEACQREGAEASRAPSKSWVLCGSRGLAGRLAHAAEASISTEAGASFLRPGVDVQVAAAPGVGTDKRLDEILAGLQALQDDEQRALRAEVARLGGAGAVAPPPCCAACGGALAPSCPLASGGGAPLGEDGFTPAAPTDRPPLAGLAAGRSATACAAHSGGARGG